MSAPRRTTAVLLALAACAVVVAAPAPRPADVVLVTLDTTRADHVGAYGFPEPVTPHLDRLSRRGVTFAQAFSSVPITTPSHATMLTGRYPPRTGVHDNGIHSLDGKTQTIATRLAARGYHARAYVASAVLDRTFGLDRGFEHYDDELRSAARPEERTAGEVDAAVARDAARLARPFFLWAHYYDPHLPYEPPPPYQSLATATREAAYAGEVAAMDAGVGKLLSRLAARKLLDGAALLVAGDHGEALGDHGESTHGVLLYDPCLQVPMVLVPPRGEAVARAIATGLARLVDVGPTLADYGAVELPGADGTSLRGAVRGQPPAAEHVYQETWMPANSFGWSPLYGLRTPAWHLIRGPGTELYDVAADPGETRDRARDRTAPAASMARILDGYAAAASAASEVPPELRERLQSLGYVSAPAGAAGTMDPRKGLPLLARMAEAKELMAAGQHDRAATILSAVVAANPENVVARSDLATCHLRSGRPRDAAREIQAALAFRDLDYLHVNLGKALQATGQLDPARESYRRAIAKSPRHADAHLALAHLEVVAGKVDSARAAVAAAEKAGIRDAVLLVLRGQLQAHGGDVPVALASFREAAALDTRSFEARAETGHALYVLRRYPEAAAAFEQALALRPDDVPLLKALGFLYLREVPKPPRARECLEKALRLAPSDPDAARIRAALSMPLRK